MEYPANIVQIYTLEIYFQGILETYFKDISRMI